MLLWPPTYCHRSSAKLYDLRLHNKLMVYGNNELEMKTENTITELETPEDGLVLEPNRLYIGRTFDFTETKSMFQR